MYLKKTESFALDGALVRFDLFMVWGLCILFDFFFFFIYFILLALLHESMYVIPVRDNLFPFTPSP